MKKILIIDDEAGIVEEVKSYFEEEGYEVFTADTGKDGIEAMERYSFDLLLVDMKLPDMSGLNVLRVCKTNYPATKVIVQTGYVDQGMIDEAEMLGRDAFLHKPFNLEFLHNEIECLLGKP